jgi:hypothetical protein
MQKTEGGIIHQEDTRDTGTRSPRAPLSGSSKPQSALSEPGVGAQVLLIFPARLLRASAPQSPAKASSFQGLALDWNRLDALCWLRDVEALFGGVHPAGDQVFQPSLGSRSNRRA